MRLAMLTLSATPSEKPSNCKYQWAMSDYLAKYQSSYLRALSGTPDAETEWHLEAETLMS